jgi:hypothetical protein
MRKEGEEEKKMTASIIQYFTDKVASHLPDGTEYGLLLCHNHTIPGGLFYWTIDGDFVRFLDAKGDDVLTVLVEDIIAIAPVQN